MAIQKITTPIIGDAAVTTDKINNNFVTSVTTNPEFQGTSHIKVPVGTTVERPASPTLGHLRFNTDLGSLEQYTSTGWGQIAPPPVINAISPNTFNGESGTSITLNGAGFQPDATVFFIPNGGSEIQAASVTYISASQIAATTPRDFSIAEEPISIKIVQGSGQNTINGALDAGGVPTWVTTAGSLGTLYEGAAVSLTLEATDPDAGGTVTYAVTSGSLPSGLTLNSSTGVISGNAPFGSGSTTYNFTVTATDNAGNNSSSRSFSVVVDTVATGGAISTFSSGGTTYRIHAFTNTGASNFVPYATINNADILLVGGGGAGGYSWGDQDTGKGGGGAGGVVFGTGKTLSAATYSLTVGAGATVRTNGNNSNLPSATLGNGSPTTGFGVTANGGGAGGQSDNYQSGSGSGAQAGGSGGGVAARNNGISTVGSSNQSSYAGWTVYGNRGGYSGDDGGNAGGGGGGGAGAVGGNGDKRYGGSSGGVGGNGGAGINMSSYFGTTYGESGWFAGGGGGGTYSGYNNVLGPQSSGGQGGGGDGASANDDQHGGDQLYTVANQDGLPNTGGGGGGSSEDAGVKVNGPSRSGAGGSGIILIRYPIS